MPLDQQKVLEYLSENYAGSTATRALWMWAGGSREKIEYRTAAREQWSVLWTEAVKMQSATPLSLVREALFDHPADEVLFGFLDALAEENLPEWRETAGLFLLQLENLAPDFGLEAIWAASQSMPRLTADSHLAVIGSRLRDLFSGEHRKILEERFHTLKQGVQTPPLAAVVDGVQLILLHAMPELVVFEDPSQFADAAEKIRSLLNSAAGASRETLIQAMEQMPEYTEILRTLPAKSGNKEREAGVSGIERQLACLQRMADKENPPSVENIAQACAHLIWCTREETPEEDDGKTSAQEEPHTEAGSEDTNNE